MAEQRVFAGAAVRKARRGAGLTQAAMAEALEISPSYLNLIEHGQRPLTAPVLVRLAERFGFELAQLTEGAVAGGVAGLRRRISDALFADLDIQRARCRGVARDVADDRRGLCACFMMPRAARAALAPDAEAPEVLAACGWPSNNGATISPTSTPPPKR